MPAGVVRAGTILPALVLVWTLLGAGCASEPAPRDEAGAESTGPPASARSQEDRRQGVILNNRAALFLKAGSPRRARTTLAQAIQLAPDLPDAHFNMGLVEARLGRHAEATAAFARAATLGFDSIDLDVARGLSLRAQNRYAQAAAAFDDALVRLPRRADLHLHKGEVLRAMGNLDSALSAFDAAVQLDNTLGSGHRYRGELLAAAGSHADAAQAYAQAVQLDTTDVAALIGQAEALRRLERFDEARVALLRALPQAPRMSRIWYVLGRVAEGAGRADEAANARQTFQRLTEARRHFDQGQVYARRGQFGDADAELTRATQVDSAFSEAWLRLGALRLENKQPAAALEVLQQVAARWPEHPEVNNLQGEALLQLGKLDSALAAFGATLATNAASVPAWLGRGRAHFAQSQFAAAQGEFRRALDLSPDEHEAYYFLGLVYSHQGGTREAIASLEQCLSVRPGHVEAHYHLGRILSGSGDTAGARRHLQQALSLRPDHERAAERLAALDTPK